jgi:hypothetical protein
MTTVVYLIQDLISRQSGPRGVFTTATNPGDNNSLTPDPELASPHDVSGCKKKINAFGPDEYYDVDEAAAA